MIKLAFALASVQLLAAQGGAPIDAAGIEAGRQIYMGSCSGCHGATGEGSQGPSLLSGRASRLPDQTLINSIRNGLPGTSMPAFPMAAARVAQVAAFVRSLTAPAIDLAVPGDPERGKQLFFGAAKCSNCHMIRGQGGYPGPDLSNIGADRTLSQLRESITKPSVRIADGYRTVTATLSSGGVVRGVARNYNNYSLQILDKSGKLHLLTRERINKVSFEDNSMMPAISSSEDALHLLAFLARQTTRPNVEGSR